MPVAGQHVAVKVPELPISLAAIGGLRPWERVRVSGWQELTIKVLLTLLFRALVV